MGSKDKYAKLDANNGGEYVATVKVKSPKSKYWDDY